jgi:hypothetical protein
MPLQQRRAGKQLDVVVAADVDRVEASAERDVAAAHGGQERVPIERSSPTSVLSGRLPRAGARAAARARRSRRRAAAR